MSLVVLVQRVTVDLKELMVQRVSLEHRVSLVYPVNLVRRANPDLLVPLDVLGARETL